MPEQENVEKVDVAVEPTTAPVEPGSTEPTDDELYKQKLEQMRLEREEKAKRKAGYTLRQEEKAEKDEPDDLDSKFQAFEERLLGQLSQVQNQNAYEAKIKQLAKSPLEEQTTREALETYVQKTGNADVDVANAYAIANGHRIQQIAQEVKRSQNSYDTSSRGYAGSQQNNPDQEIQLSDAEARLASNLKNMGYNVEDALGK